MVKHYITVAFRHLIRQKKFSAINITGLALGMTCCLFIFLWIDDEKSIDNFHAQGRNLYNVFQTVTNNGQTTGSYSTPFALIFQNRGERDTVNSAVTLADIQTEIPEIQKLNSYATGYELPWGHPETFQSGEKIQKFKGSRAGRDFFTMFSYPLVAGTAASALDNISSIAISQEMAEYFFGTPEQAIGKSLRYESRLDFIVKAVFENVTPQSSLSFDFLINWESQIKQLDLASPVILTTLLLDEPADVAQVEIKLNRFLKARLPQNSSEEVTLGLKPFGDKYLYSAFVNGKPQDGRMVYVRIFAGVAIFILIIACINFMNLATARSVKRAKEVGVRKTVGSSRATLAGQFLGESWLLSFFALVLSVVLIEMLLPSFNTLTGKHITSPLATPSYWVALLALVSVTGFASGSYPALFLSSLKPVTILKGNLNFTLHGAWFRKGLVCFQFFLSIALLIVTIVVSRQTHYVQNANLGYDRSDLVYVQIEGELNPRYALFKERALQMPGVMMVDRSTETPHAMGFVVDENDGFAETTTGDDAINWEGKQENISVGFKPASVGFDFLSTMKLEVAEGRAFSKSFSTDSADAFMINEEAVRQMGIDDPIGKWVSAWNKKGHIIGVLKDYHTGTLREPIKPLILDVKEYEYFGVIIVRLEPGKTKEGLASLEAVCREVNPNYPFVFQFLDQEYDHLYRNEQVVAKLTNIFAMLGIIISCLGLLGLVMFAGERRTKEIGIRKVMGASVPDIFSLLLKEFLILVILSFLVASPLTGYVMHQWLQGFAYRIPLSWEMFAIAGISVMIVALLTVSINAFQASVTNPVKSLRTE